MPKYRVISTFHEGTDDAKAPGEIIELTEEQAGPFVKTKRLAPYTAPSGFAQEVKNKSVSADTQPPEPSTFAQEVERHKLLPASEHAGWPDELPTMTVKQLTALPEWEQVPEPKPTKKAEILAAIRAVRGTPEGE